MQPVNVGVKQIRIMPIHIPENYHSVFKRQLNRLPVNAPSKLERRRDIVEDFSYPAGSRQHKRAEPEDAAEDPLIHRDRLHLSQEKLQSAPAQEADFDDDSFRGYSEFGSFILDEGLQPHEKANDEKDTADNQADITEDRLNRHE